MRFNFVGEFSPKSEGAYKADQTDSGFKYNKVNGSVIASKNNRAFVEISGFYNKTLKAWDTDGEEFEVDYENRNDPDILKKASFGSKSVLSIDDDRREFLSSYDYAKTVSENFDEFKGKKCVFTGRVTKNAYNGKVTNRFEISSIYEADEDRKNGFEITAISFWTKDGIDTADFKNEKKIYVNAYTYENFSDKVDGKRVKYKKYVPISLTLNCAKIDFDNEKHVKMLNFRLRNLGLIYEDGKIKNNLKAKKVYSNEVVLAYSRGAEEVEFDESQLTKAQKEAIELGLKTVDDFRPKGGVYGDVKEEFRIKDFTLMGDFAEGMVEADLTAEELEDEIFNFAATSSAPKKEKKKAKSKDEEEFEKAVNPPVDDEDEDEDESEETENEDEMSDDEIDDLFD